MVGFIHAGDLAYPDVTQIPEVLGIRSLLALVNTEDRLQVFDAIMEGYCPDCGVDDPRCPCWNDE